MPFDKDGNEIVENNTQDNLVAELLADELEPEEIEQLGGPSPATKEVSALQQQIKDLEKEKLGLLTATKEERRKRQGANERLLQLEGAVNTMLSQRQQQGIESVTESEAADARSKGIPVTYDEDGNGWIDQSYVNSLVSPYEQKILELEQKLQFTSDQNAAVDAAEKMKLGIIGEDERFVPASNRYRAARKWVEDAVLDYTRSHGITRNITSGEALDNVFDVQLRREFAEQFDGLDLIDVVTAEDSQEHFRRTLNNIANAMPAENELTTTPKEKMDSRFQKVLDKPSSLGNQANAKAGQLTIMDKLGNLSTQDLMDLDDKSVDALMRAMKREEMNR
jgi:hypothetical protein